MTTRKYKRKKTLQNINNELHGRVVVVQHQDLVHGRLFGPCPRLDGQAGIAVIIKPSGRIGVVVLSGHHNPSFLPRHFGGIIAYS